MEAGERVVGVFTDMRRKGRHRTGIAGFQLGVGLDITSGRGSLIFLNAQRLECAQRLSLAPENEITHRPAAELSRLGRERSADAYAGAELLVGSFQTRRDIDGIAISRIVEEAATAEITDDSRPGVNADAGYSQRNSLAAPTLAK